MAMIAENKNNMLILKPKEYEKNHLALVQNSKDIDLTILNKFEPHTLLQQNTAALMDRVDSKFVLPIKLFTPLMTAISEDYSILSAYGRKVFSYQTTYFDNKERQFYLDHHNGKLNRYKVRYRRYVESDMGYMEIKFKNNKKRTIKQRIPMSCISPDQASVNQFVEKTLGYFINLETALFVNYQRITLINKSNLERITIDLNLSFHNASNHKKSIQDKTFIIEVKQERKPYPSSCREFIKHKGIKSTNFSKYCMGTILTNDTAAESGVLKINRFKSVINSLKKLNQLH